MDVAYGAMLGGLGAAFAYFYPRGGLKAVRREWPMTLLFAVVIVPFALLSVAGVEIGILDAFVILAVLAIPGWLLTKLLGARPT